MRNSWWAIISSASCVALATIVTMAQPVQQAVARKTAQPTAEQLIAKYVQAIGGRAAIERVTSRVTTGTMDLGGTLISMELSEKAPDKFLSILEVPGVGAVKQGYDGKIGWEQTPNQGVQELEGATLAAVRRNAQLYRWLRMKELFEKLELSGAVKVGDRDTYVMDATPPEGHVEKFYFDSETGLLLKRDYKLDTPDGLLTFETFYEDYRVVDGIKMAFALRRVGPDNVVSLKFTEIKQNVELDNARFAKPLAP